MDILDLLVIQVGLVIQDKGDHKENADLQMETLDIQENLGILDSLVIQAIQDLDIQENLVTQERAGFLVILENLVLLVTVVSLDGLANLEKVDNQDILETLVIPENLAIPEILDIAE